MRASQLTVWLALPLVAGLSGCYARYTGPALCLPGYGYYGGYPGPYGPYAGCGLYGEGYGLYADGPGPAGPYGYETYFAGVSRDRTRLRERLRMRGDDDYRSRRPRGRLRDRRRRGAIDDYPYDPYVEGAYLDGRPYLDGGACPCDMGEFGDCGCHSCECGSCGGYPLSMGHCGPCMDCPPAWEGAGWDGAGYCESCQPPMTYDGTYEGVYDGMAPGWHSPMPVDAYPPGSCADGSCGIGTPPPDWSMAVPYSHEAFPSEAMPQTIPEPIRSREQREPLLAPPAQLPPDDSGGYPPEGQFEAPQRNGVSTQPYHEPYFAPPAQFPPGGQYDTSQRNRVNRSPQRIMPARHARLVPSAF